jgi:hypothetical protein
MALLLLASLGVSCGGDDDGEEPNMAGRGGGNAATSGGGMIECDDGVTCGSECCRMPADSMVEPCCRDVFSGECGMLGGFAGDACVAILPMDTRCPAVTIMGANFMLPSCCTADNMCGINAGMFGMASCIELGEAEMRAMEMAMMFGQGDGGMPGMPGGGFMIDFPEPRACE